METRTRSGALVPIALAILLPALAYFALGRYLLNFSDEGYLWYGVRRTLAGDVPLRDFQSYHPGRYYWCAAFAPLFGQGILGVRAACAAFEGLGLLCALQVVRRVASKAGWLLLFGLLLTLWMFPRHKLFEPATACMAAWFAVRLMERPSRGRHFAAGAFVGLAGCFGSNLGLYAGLSMGAVILVLAWKQPEPGRLARTGAWAAGVVLGFAPFLAMLLFVPGFARGFTDSLRMIADHGTNIAKPWPWPWRVTTDVSTRIGFRDAMESLAFLLPIVALPGLLLAVLRARGMDLGERAACLASSVVALFFLHHASVNSGAWHLAQCIQPLLIALIAVPVLFSAHARLARLVVWSGLALVTLGFTLTWNPILSETLGEHFRAHEIAGESIELPTGQAKYLAALERTVKQTVGDAPLFLAPNMPGIYCVLGKESPSWWIYFYWSMSPAEQEALVRELEERRVEWALVVDPPPGDEREKSFKKTHPLVWEHFQTKWKRVPSPGLPADLVLFRRS